MSQSNLKFEFANILYNHEALYSQLVASANRGSTDGLKSACNNFCLAAGVISHLKKIVIPELRSTPKDIDIATLECLQLLLVQTQECYWHKAVIDRYRDALIAKLVAQISDLYSSACNWSKKSQAISSKWIYYIMVKHYHFAAAAQYRQAHDCLEQRRYGEEVARLQDGLACVNEALNKQNILVRLF